jgi:transposase
LEKIRESINIQYGLDIGVGALAHTLQRMGNELTPQYHAIIGEMRDSPVKHADETSWPMNGEKFWCWAFMSPAAVAYTIEETRGKGVPDIVLGKTPSGVLVRDDYGAYAHMNMEQQSCWAHLMRNSHDAVKQDTASNEMKRLHADLTVMYEKLSTIIAQPFDEQKRTKSYAAFLKQITAIATRRYRAEDVKKIQTRMSNQMGNLITALTHENVPLTNNMAERQIRPMAVIRKISGGSRSAAGAMATAVNMSVMQTITLKGQSVFDRLGELLTPVSQKFSLERTE